MEGVGAVAQVVIGYAAHVFRVGPIGIDAVHLIRIDDLVSADVLHRCVLDVDIAAVGNRDGIARQLLVLRLDTGEAQRRNGSRAVNKGRVKLTIAVGVTEEQFAGRRPQRFCFCEIGVVRAVQSVVVV